MIILGETIRALRQRNGRTQDALAGEIGVTAQAVSRWEKGICYSDMELDSMGKRHVGKISRNRLASGVWSERFISCQQSRREKARRKACFFLPAAGQSGMIILGKRMATEPRMRKQEHARER